MPHLTDVIARHWSEAKAALESSVRSGTRPGAGADVDAILERIAGLIRTIGREELLAVVRDSGTEPPVVDRPPAVGDPMVTTDIDSSGHPVMTADLRAPAAANPDFEAGLSTHHADGKAPTIDQTGDFSPEGEGLILLDSKAEWKPSETARKIPTVPGYEILGVLGRGGMGVVYKATQIGLRRTVALKMILAGEHASEVHLERFAAEARAVAQIRHPGIVQIYEIGEHEGLPYFSLEYCPGGSLDKKLKHEPQPPREAATLLEVLARAMAAAHDAGVVHRDLKPANVLLDSAGAAKITDFGLARELDDTEGHTRTGSILGTPYYMAPEQAAGKTREVGTAADQYSLGATFYEVLTGRPPFQGASVMETLEQVRNREPVPPTQLNPTCPKDLETICLKALQKEPAKRYSSCAALADDLRAFLEGRPIAARPVGTTEKAWRWAKRNPRVAGLASLVALLLLVLGIGGSAAAVVFDEKKREAEQARDEKDTALKAETKALEEKSIAFSEKTKALEAKSKALLESNQSYDFTRETVFVALDQIPLALSQAVFARGAEQQVLEALGAMLEKQLGLALTRGLPDRAVMNFHIKMGDLMVRQGKGPDADRHYLAALAITERLMKAEVHEKDKAKGNHALVLHKLGKLGGARGDGATALKFYGEAAKLQREVMDRPQTREIPPAEAKASLASTLIDTADLYRRASLFDRALPACAEALELWDEVVKSPATAYTETAGQSLADAYILHGRILARLGKDDGAEKALAEGESRHRTLLKAAPTNITEQILAARAAREYGDFLLMRNKLDEAVPPHAWDLELTRALLLTPEIVAAQADLSDVYYRSATLALKKGDRPASEKLYRKCLDLRLAVAEARPADEGQPIRVANAQARCGLHAEAAAAMETLVAKYKNNRNVVRQAAFNIAICVAAIEAGRPANELSEAEKTLRAKYAERSLTLIEDLVDRLKFTDVVQLKTDPDLDAIRREPRFQAVVKRLEKPLAKP